MADKSKRDIQKKPQMTLKERRAEKRAKFNSSVENIPRRKRADR